MNISTSSEIPAAEYKLFVRKGSPRLYLRNTDEGVYLSPKGIGWFFDGRSHTQNWDQIAGVNLVVTYIPKNGPIGMCRIIFRDGSVLSVLSASKWGHSDDERNVEYGRFIADFHRAIPDTARSGIKFQTGLGRGSFIGLAIVFVIAASFFIVLPLSLTIYFKALEALWITLAGAAFLFPVYRMAKSAAPTEYDSLRVPDDFFP
jgi:hypothetical protein